LHVLDIDEHISLPAGGFLLQGSMEQIIEDERNLDLPAFDSGASRPRLNTKRNLLHEDNVSKNAKVSL
jgi:hypothetical protein